MTTESRLDVTATDGTSLAVWAAGSGPALVMVHGSMHDHTANRPFVDQLCRGVTTYAMDRRGFGASGDAAKWTLEQEFDDVATVVHAVAERTGGAVGLWGHSFGASCAMGGAARSDAVSHLVLYEPSLGLRYPPGSIDAVERALGAGDYDRVIAEVLTRVLEMSEHDVEVMRAGPRWRSRLATARTVPRECRAENDWVWKPGQFDSITGATLMLAGSQSPSELKAVTAQAAAALGAPQVRLLEGHGHLAIRTAPALVDRIVLDFLRS